MLRSIIDRARQLMPVLLLMSIVVLSLAHLLPGHAIEALALTLEDAIVSCDDPTVRAAV